MKIVGQVSAILVSLASAVYGQALVEHSLITAASAAAAAGAKNAGKSVGGVFQGLSEKLKGVGDAGNIASPPPSAQSASPASSPREAPRPAPVLRIIDPSEIAIGLERDELIARFGSPLVSTIDTTTSRTMELMWYATGRSTQAKIKLIGGRVAAITPPLLNSPKPAN